MSDGIAVRPGHPDFYSGTESDQSGLLGPLSSIGSTLDEHRGDHVVWSVLRAVRKFFCGYERTAIELSSSATYGTSDSRLDNEERDDPAVEVRGRYWAIEAVEVPRAERLHKLERFLDHLESTPAPGSDETPYISEMVSEQARQVLGHLVDMGIFPEIAPDPEGGLSIRLEHDDRVAIMTVDDDEWRLMINPLDNSRRIIKTFRPDTDALKVVELPIG